MTDHLGPLRRATTRTSRRLVTLLSTVGDPSVIAVGEWTIKDLAVHLTDVFEHYPRYLRGEAELFADPLHVTRHNAEAVSAGGGLSVDEAARRIASTLEEIDDLLKDRHEPVQWHGGIELSPSAFAAVIGSEAVVHGYDVASAERRYTACDPSDAGVIMANALHLLPLYLDNAAAEGVTASFDIRLRGGERRFLSLRDGVLDVSTRSGRADCVVLADGETFLLVGYNRIGQWRATFTGKIVAWGRRPWLALKLPGLLTQI